MLREMICICCPVGCHLSVESEDGEVLSVSGNKCPKGKAYALEEVLSPKRVVTAVVKTRSRELPYLPVKTTAALPKEKIGTLLGVLYRMELDVPVSCGQCILEDFEDTGVSVVVTRTCMSQG